MKNKLLIFTLITGSFWSFAQTDSLLTTIKKQQYVIDLLLKDTDKDNVSDYWDKCHKTPIGARVDGTGCALDTDLDGILDLYDKCVSTPGVTDMQGCPQEYNPESLTTNLELNFPSKSTQIDEINNRILENITHFVLKYGKGKIFIIEGHANEYKIEKKNQILSLQRAQKIKDYLVNHGVNAEQLEVDAKGSQDLLYPECENIKNCWKNGKGYLNELNRRVFLKIKES